MKQRHVFRGAGALVGVLTVSGCAFDIGTFDYTEPQFVGSYVGDGATTVIALSKDRTFTAIGVPDEVLDDAADGVVEEVPAELEGTWKYVSGSAPDRVELTVTDIDGEPAELGEVPLYVADADDLFFLPDQLGREKIVVSRSG
ncbi:hypothetical protein APR04_003256 [Promicromonospora umidemergens]|uniref:Uncharacterized protein n=1 Tax=Promicromonospora umidemergens TaxID=629679 RepID=A0ABP8WDS7_9MICO|nr:hypothetical protein [Promicromonospora umidemergens]MCP2284335.1 hypothetical protein [Promicromonospora umidemergens]